MLKYAKIIDENTGLCNVGIGSDEMFYRSMGMTLLDVCQSDINGDWFLSAKCPMKSDEQKEVELKQKIALLHLTSADVERGIYQAIGKDFEDILDIINNLATDIVDIKALKIELKANHFYRGNPYVDAVGNLLGFSKEQLDKFFETNDYFWLLPENNVSENN